MVSTFSPQAVESESAFTRSLGDCYALKFEKVEERTLWGALSNSDQGLGFPEVTSLA